ncbi:MAG: PH domain-containing protein [Terriglobia bacterium]
MRFQTKFDTWLAITLLISMAATLVTPVVLLILAAVRQRPVPWGLAIPPAIWVVAIAATLPQYYDIREDGLYVRQGWHKALIPYSLIFKVQAVSNTLSSAVYSSERVKIDTQSRGSFMIAPVDRDRFMSELARHTPGTAFAGSGRLY